MKSLLIQVISINMCLLSKNFTFLLSPKSNKKKEFPSTATRRWPTHGRRDSDQHVGIKVSVLKGSYFAQIWACRTRLKPF